MAGIYFQKKILQAQNILLECDRLAFVTLVISDSQGHSISLERLFWRPEQGSDFLLNNEFVCSRIIDKSQQLF